MDKTNGGVMEAREGGGFGWGEGEVVGGNADNCNWTTIKIQKTKNSILEYETKKSK